MNKDEIFLTIFLYCLVILISSSKPFWDQIGSLVWVRTLTAEMQKPVFPEGAPIRVTPLRVTPVLVMTQPVHRAVTARVVIARKGIHPSSNVLALPLNGITTVNKISAKEETSKRS